MYEYISILHINKCTPRCTRQER